MVITCPRSDDTAPRNTQSAREVEASDVYQTAGTRRQRAREQGVKMKKSETGRPVGASRIPLISCTPLSPRYVPVHYTRAPQAQQYLFIYCIVMYTTSNTPHDIIRAHYHTIACPCSAISINADHPRDTRPDTAGVAGLTLIHLAMKAL